MSQQLPEELRALENARQRLQNLCSSLSELLQKLYIHERRPGMEPLPSWSSLQNSSQDLLRTLSSISTTLMQNSEVLTAAHAYPLGNFPSQAQQMALYSLLRKRLDPTAQSELESYAKKAESFAGESKDLFSLDEDAITDLWDWAGPAENDIAREVFFGKEEDDDEEDEESEPEEMEGLWTEGVGLGSDGRRKSQTANDVNIHARPMMDLPRLLLYMQTGGEGQWRG